MADGYGEFSGGGSVKWEIKNGDGDSGSGNKDGAKGRDKDPKNGGFFRVLINGNVVNTYRCDGTTIRVEWSEEENRSPARA
jgi:hypothetical protein